MILAGRITVNRMPADVGQKVSPGDEVRINGELVGAPTSRGPAWMYTSRGRACHARRSEGRPTVRKAAVDGSGGINVGRLDYNTEGLLLFTTWVSRQLLMHPRYEVEREYAVRIMGRLTDEQAGADDGRGVDDGPEGGEGH